MLESDDFHDGLQTDEEKQKEWTDAAEFFVGLRTPPPEPTQQEKRASFQDVQSAILNAVRSHPKLVGSLAGAAGGGALGYIKGDDEHKGRSALLGAGGGALAGLGAGALVPHLKGGIAKHDPSGLLTTLKDPASWPFMAAGGAGLGSLTYHGSRPREELSGKSKNEVSTEKNLQMRAAVPEETFSDKMQGRNAEFQHGAAKAYKEHPRKAALIGGMTGIGAGLLASKILGAGR